MALSKPSPGLLPAENYRRFGLAFEAIDAAAAAVAREVLDRGDAIGEQQRARADGDAALQDGLDAQARDADTRFATMDARLIAEARARISTASADPSRPGDGPTVFTAAGTSGGSEALPGLPASLVAFGDNGTVARVVGAGIVASRRQSAIERGRVYRARWAFQRRANAADPSGHAIVIGVAWLDQARNQIPGAAGTTTVKAYLDLRVSDGRQEFATSIGASGATGVLTAAPAGAVYARPFVRTYGEDGATDIEVIDLVDLSDLVVVPDIAADAVARLDALESADLPDRVALLEANGQTPNSRTYATRSDAAAASVPVSVTTLETRGRATPGDGRGGLYARTPSLAAGADGFASADGAIWTRVLLAQDVFEAALAPQVLAWLNTRPTDPTGLGAGKLWRNGSAVDGYSLTITGTNT